jgi:uncharacterized lipoprotein YmbA
MRTANLRVLLLLMAGPAFVDACTSPNPALYTLAPVSGTPQSGGPPVVVLHQIAVARYLERPEIVRSSEDYRLAVMANSTWGEPLAPMIGRVLTEDLSQRLPGTTVIDTNGAITAQADASLEVSIKRMDIDATRALGFAAQAAVVFTNSRNGEAIRTVRTSVPLASPATSEEVRAISIALGRLADEIADMLRQPSVTRRRG